MIFSAEPSERKLTLPKSGKLFLLVIVLTMLPAYALSVSLMFLMGSIFIGMQIYNLVAAILNLRSLVLEVHKFPELFAGSQAPLQITLAAKHRFPKPRHLEVKLVADDVVVETELIPVVDGQETLSLHLTPQRRGRIEVTGLYVESAYPFGLFSRQLRFPFRKELLVYPGLLASLPENIQAQKQDVGLIPRNSGDYQYLDNYRHGDDVRLIHWKKSSILENPVLRKDLVSSKAMEPRMFVPDPCPQFEYALSAMVTWFQEMNDAEGWHILTDEGLQAVDSREQFLQILATIRPLRDMAAVSGFMDEGLRPTFASQIGGGRKGL